MKKTMLVALLLLLAPNARARTHAAPHEQAGGYDLAPGPYTVGLAHVELHDAARNKELTVTVRYPTGGAAGVKHPVVVFSHGLGGNGDTAFADLTAHWASHGYAVLLPTHADSIQQRKAEGQTVSNPKDDPKAFLGTADLVGRVADVKLVVDSLDAIQAKVPGLVLDPTRLAIAGHSAGAFTTQLAFGVKARGDRVTGSSGFASIGDPRFDCAIVISGQGLTSQALGPDSWSELSKPMLVITGSADQVPWLTSETPASREDPYLHSRGRAAGGPPVYLLTVEGATHSSFGGGSKWEHESADVPVVLASTATASATLAFLDATLGGDAGAQQVLDSKAIVALDPKKVAWVWK